MTEQAVAIRLKRATRSISKQDEAPAFAGVLANEKLDRDSVVGAFVRPDPCHPNPANVLSLKYLLLLEHTPAISEGS